MVVITIIIAIIITVMEGRFWCHRVQRRKLLVTTLAGLNERSLLYGAPQVGRGACMGVKVCPSNYLQQA